MGEKEEALEKARTVIVEISNMLGEMVKPEAKILDLAEKIEAFIESKEAMWAFPVNICIGSTAAHYTPNLGEDTCIPHDDIVKMDFGVAVDGYALDKAVSLYFGDDEDKKTMIATAQEALEKAITSIRPGLSYTDVAWTVYDYVKSRGFNVIKNLHGHKIERWKLHLDEIPIHPEIKTHGAFEEGAIYAIEIFVTDGNGFAETLEDARIYSLPSILADVRGRIKIPIHVKSAREVFGWIWRNRRTLPFSLRHLKKVFDETTIKVALAILERNGLIERYNVLREVKGTVAQAEETILVKRSGVEILTRAKKLEVSKNL